ncbi:MAG: hypothetical protein KDD42_06980 [Bdellovibrionales bacterium]|nr:hypothetical protein [Bdellovibrionales bacterium]
MFSILKLSNRPGSTNQPTKPVSGLLGLGALAVLAFGPGSEGNELGIFPERALAAEPRRTSEAPLTTNNLLLSQVQEIATEVYTAQNSTGARFITDANEDLLRISDAVAQYMIGSSGEYWDLKVYDGRAALESLLRECLELGYYFRGNLVGTPDTGYYISVSLYVVGDPVSQLEIPNIDLPAISSQALSGTAEVYEVSSVLVERYDTFPGNSLQPGSQILMLAGEAVPLPDRPFVVLHPAVIAQFAKDNQLGEKLIYKETLADELGHVALAPVIERLGKQRSFVCETSTLICNMPSL